MYEDNSISVNKLPFTHSCAQIAAFCDTVGVCFTVVVFYYRVVVLCYTVVVFFYRMVVL